jgi:hypothetical protein
MDSNEKFWLLIWTIFGIIAISLTLTIGYFSNRQYSIMSEKGYVQKLVKSLDNTNRPNDKIIWTKPSENTHILEEVKP